MKFVNLGVDVRTNFNCIKKVQHRAFMKMVEKRNLTSKVTILNVKEKPESMFYKEHG